jgi:hypothetical protein
METVREVLTRLRDEHEMNDGRQIEWRIDLIVLHTEVN